MRLRPDLCFLGKFDTHHITLHVLSFDIFYWLTSIIVFPCYSELYLKSQLSQAQAIVQTTKKQKPAVTDAFSAAVSALSSDAAGSSGQHQRGGALDSNTNDAVPHSGDSSVDVSECLICRDAYTTPVFTGCQHIYCKACITAWHNSMARKNITPTCPECRAPISLRELVEVEVVVRRTEGEPSTDAAAATKPVKKDDHRRSLIAPSILSPPSTLSTASFPDVVHGGTPSSAATAPHSQAKASVSVFRELYDDVLLPHPAEIMRTDMQRAGEWGAKVDAIVKHAIFILQNFKTHTIRSSATQGSGSGPEITVPAAKILVFSQFPEMLQLVKEALQANSVKSALLLGNPVHKAKILHQFHNDASLRVLLLSTRQDSSGLTLHVARHVILCEPSVAKSLEAQAVRRAHRIGQQFSCYVHKMVVRDSVEEHVVETQHRQMMESLRSSGGIGAEDDEVIEEAEDEDEGDVSVGIGAGVGGVGGMKGKELVTLAQAMDMVGLSFEVRGEASAVREDEAAGRGHFSADGGLLGVAGLNAGARTDADMDGDEMHVYDFGG